METCLSQLKHEGKIVPFQLGRQDFSDKFQIPQKVYGRSEEIRSIIKIFERVARGRKEMALVSGYSGVGKTVLVRELRKPVMTRGSCFLSGKFDQVNRNIAYSGISQAFRKLIRQILGKSKSKIQFWKERLLTALGPNSEIITDMIPEVEKIIGKPAPVQELTGAEARNRFELIFRNFVSVFAQKEHPLVLFLDDLQWADSASLNLIHLLATDDEIRAMLIIGAYRENEVSASHPVIMAIDEIKKPVFRSVTFPCLH